MILMHGEFMDIGHGVNVFTMDMLVKNRIQNESHVMDYDRPQVILGNGSGTPKVIINQQGGLEYCSDSGINSRSPLEKQKTPIPTILLTGFDTR